MLEKQLNELEERIASIEDRIEEDNDYTSSEVFQIEYEEMVDSFSMIKETEIDPFPYGEVSEKREEAFLIQKKRFKKLESRIKTIKDETDIEGDSDSDLMSDKDGNEED